MEKKSQKPLRNTVSELLCVICTLFLLVSLLSFTALAEDSNVKISASLSSKLAETSATEKVPVIIILPDQQISFTTAAGKEKIESKQKDLITFLETEKSKKNVKDIKPMSIINAVAANVTPAVLASLIERSDVSTVELDAIYTIGQSETSSVETEASTAQESTASTNAWGVDKIGAPAVWQQGITGKGITVAVVDTGVDATHPDLDDLDDNPSTTDPKVIGWIDYINSKSSPYDDHGHGTHVSGTISGTGANGIQTGVAPGTNLIVAKVFDSDGF